MANKPAKRTQKSNVQSTEDHARSRIAPTAKQATDLGTPIEHYHGETASKRIGELGDLDEETLDRDAPYNKTYGRMDK